MSTNDAARANAPALPENPSLYRLLSIYWDRYDLLNQAMKATDATEEDTPEFEAADAAQTEAGDRLNEVAIAVCAYVPTWNVDAAIKHSFVTGMMAREGGRLSKEELDALMTSVSGLYRHRGDEA